MIVFLTDVKVREETIRVITGIHDDSEYPSRIVTMSEILTTRGFHNKLSVFKDGDFDYVVSSGFIFPTLNNVNEDSDDVIIFEDNFNINNLADMVLFDDDMTEVHTLLEGMIPDYNPKEFQDMCVSFSTTVDQIIEFNFRYELSRKIDNDLKAIVNKYNNDSKATSVVQTTLSLGNVTISMENGESEMYIRVPSPTYNKYAARSEDYEGDSVSPQDVNAAFDPYGGIIEAYHPSDYRDVIDEIGEENIRGNPDNNYLPIQKNERRFHSALSKYIVKSITLYLKESNMFTEEELERRLNNNVLPTHTYLALKSFVKALVNVNWRHSNSVPLNEFRPVDESSSDEDGEGTESADLSSEYYVEDTFDIMDGKADIANYFVVIDSFMEDPHLTAFAWAELIIKLARWGTRKPTAVAFVEESSGTGCTQILNLNDFTIQEDLTYLNDLEPKKYNGYEYMPMYLISTGRSGYMDASGYHNNLGYEPSQVIEDTPLGIMCRQSFETKSGVKHRNVYFDFLTILELYKTGNGSILGIDYYEEDNTFEVSEKLEESIEKGLHLNATLKMLMKSHADKDMIYPNPEIFKEMYDVKGFKVKEDPLSYTMYSMVLNLISESKLSEVYRNVSKEEEPVKFVTKALSKTILNYLFIPKEHNNTIEKGLNNLNEIHKGFEVIEVGSNFKSSIGKTSNFVTSSNSAKPLQAIIKMNLKNVTYYAVESLDYKDSGCNYVMIKSDSGDEIVEKEGIKEHNNVSAYYTLAILILQNQLNNRASKIFMKPEMITELNSIYIQDHNMDPRNFVRTVKAKMAQRKG